MMDLLPILVAVVALAGIVVLIMTILGRRRTRGKQTDREAILKDATKRLAQNPRNPEALRDLAELHYQDQAWDKAYKMYETLIELATGHPGIDEFEANLHYAISALKLNLLNEAYKGFAVARSLKQDNLEVNYNLGNLEFQRNNYEKAIQYLNQARLLDPEHAPTLRCLGHSLFKMKKYKDALAYIRKAIDLAPDDKESLFTLAECYYEVNQTDQALRIFGHLRPDPAMGPNACLFSGSINLKNHRFEKAIEDFEIGLKHQNVKSEIRLELKYRLASVLLRQQDVGKALVYLRQIQDVHPNFKDVPLLISKYQELNANKNMQIYLMAPSADFVALCRKIVMNYFPRAKVKITNIAVNKNDWADILAEVDTPKWSDLVMFRFIRNQGSVGELIVRDFHAHLKEVKAGKGLCLSVGTFTDEAKRYTEARLIDLIGKEKLSTYLNSVDTKPAKAGGTVKK
ncbi:MAG: tetratricopeptide repeat protein [Spirochaetaceae bacterium]|jgi:tetratricopeptide (TPR) repeat protein|nr:tetratricopeptide repeat protein [Spirochaetaceae bacterium]